MSLCSKHKKYKAIHKPRAVCWRCWATYADENPDATYTAQDMEAILKAGWEHSERILMRCNAELVRVDRAVASEF